MRKKIIEVQHRTFRITYKTTKAVELPSTNKQTTNVKDVVMFAILEEITEGDKNIIVKTPRCEEHNAFCFHVTWQGENYWTNIPIRKINAY